MNSYLNNFIKEKLGDKKGKILDLGAGDFSDVKHIREKGWFCEGVDKNMGVDLNRVYISENAPFDIIYSNYVMHFLKNKEALVETAYRNLKDGGWFFLYIFHKNDENMKKGFAVEDLKNILSTFFVNIGIEILDIYDDEPGHNHWHKVIQATARK